MGCFYNLWQPTTYPVEMNPLALMDWTTTSKEEVRKVALGYKIKPTTDKSTGEQIPAEAMIAQPIYNKDHGWYFYPNMQTDEALVFTQVDGRQGYARHTFHTAVKHQLKPNPIPRQSVEVRLLCGFLPENPASAHR